MMKTVNKNCKQNETDVVDLFVSFQQLHDVQSHHPIGFVSFLTPSLQLVYTTLFEPNNEGIYQFSRLGINTAVV